MNIILGKVNNVCTNSSDYIIGVLSVL